MTLMPCSRKPSAIASSVAHADQLSGHYNGDLKGTERGNADRHAMLIAVKAMPSGTLIA